MHSDKGTQNGAKFVENLANMISSTFVEYGKIVSRDSFVRRVLQKDCAQAPDWCFQEGILTPLKNLLHPPKETWYIVIDALDECSVDGQGEILKMLKSKVRRLPKWLKVITTSRNVSSITSYLDGVRILELKSKDERNLEDIVTYLSLKIYPLKTSILHDLKTYFSIKNNSSLRQQIVTSIMERAQGNFLFARVLLDCLLGTPERVSCTDQGFPKTLDNIFQLNFERKFSSRESFRPFREIFEILVAAYTPLSAEDIFYVLKRDYPDLDYEYDLMPKLKEVSLFFWDRSEKGLVRIYHSSLSDWLTRESNKGNDFYVKKQKGHRRLAEYYLEQLKRNMKALTPAKALYLACHIVEAGSNKNQVDEFQALSSNRVNGSDEVKTTSLHLSSRLVNPEITKLLMTHFDDMDCLDNNHRTPAFIAATSGNLENLIILSSKGADINYTVSCPNFKAPTDVRKALRECKRRTCEYSSLHIAAQEGNVDVVKFLIDHHVSKSKTTGCNNTAVQLAAANGHLEVVIALKKAGAYLDGISLHHAAARDHHHVVEYLLKEGVRDLCIDFSPFIEFCPATNIKGIKVHVYDNIHLKIGETALHVAAKNNHPSVIKTLLRYRDEESAINCSNAAGRWPLHEAVYYNNYDALQAMLAAGLNMSVRCNLRPRTSCLIQKCCPCEFTPLHIAAKYGHHSAVQLLITEKADLNAEDCNGSTPLHIASCHGMVSIINLLVKSGGNINSRSFNGSTPFHSAAACFATSAFWLLLDLGSDFFAKDSKDMTALHYVVKDIEVVGREYFDDLYVQEPKDWIEVGPKEKEPWERVRHQRFWLNVMIAMSKSFVTNMVERELPYSLNSVLYLYSSVFFELGKKANASSVLTGNNGLDQSSLVIIAMPFAYFYDVTFQALLKSRVFTINRPYEPSVVPKQLTRAISNTFTIFYPNVRNCTILTVAVRANMAHTVNTYLQAGADVNCQDQSEHTPLSSYLHSGGRHMSKVLVKHGATVEISCDQPFEKSTLHLISYHKLHYLHYLPQFLRGDEKWSKFLSNESFLFDYFLNRYEEVREEGRTRTIHTGDGPLTSAMKLHPRGTKILNECFDAEGYNALHRAAQGANVVAIEKFLSWGADPTLKNSDGYSPLWLAVFYSVKYTPFLNLRGKNFLTDLEVDLASESASVILDHVLQTNMIDIGCSESQLDLTIYHIAAIRGMWRFISYLLSERRVKGIDVNCPNKDGITPLYLAMLVGGLNCEWPNPWCKVVEIIRLHGGILQFPTLEAEYFLIFDLFFGMSPDRTYSDLAEEEIITLQANVERHDCEGYELNTDLSKTSGELYKLHNDYIKKIKKCSSGSEECSPEINRYLFQLEALNLVLHKLYRFKLQHTIIRSGFVRFLEEETWRMQMFLLHVTQPHERVSCRFGRKRNERKTKTQGKIGIADRGLDDKEGDNEDEKNDDDNDDKDAGNGCECMNIDRALRKSYSDFKTSFDQMQKLSEQAISSISSMGKKSPRILLKLNRALLKLDTTMACDWQAITRKYITLNFQIQISKHGTLHVNEHSRVVSITDFASSRMKKIFIDSSTETLELALKLASEKSSTVLDDLYYLTNLKFRKPPLWKGTFDLWG
ncbi:ankyrin repeat domain-containing protein 50-like [Stylophora pistillata]|nr:ankyrin repeat domain-containing protein 50-like [Stylophora pistillata]